jgi:FkbM family methyltransferase
MCELPLTPGEIWRIAPGRCMISAMADNDLRASAPGYARLMWMRSRLEGDAGIALVDELVHEGDVVVDAGAERGIFTLRMTQLAGPQGEVHAFEPNPESVECLRGIADVEANLEVHPVALSDSAGTARLYVPVEHGDTIGAVGSLVQPRGGDCETVDVETTRLDDALGDAAARVSFIKCDVEGHELAVLRGAERILTEARPSLLVEIERRHAGERMEETFEYLASLGYEGFAVRPEGPAPLAEFDVERDQLAFLGQDFETGTMPPGYVNDFYFKPFASSPSPASAPATDSRAAASE